MENSALNSNCNFPRGDSNESNEVAFSDNSFQDNLALDISSLSLKITSCMQSLMSADIPSGDDTVDGSKGAMRADLTPITGSGGPSNKIILIGEICYAKPARILKDLCSSFSFIFDDAKAGCLSSLNNIIESLAPGTYFIIQLDKGMSSLQLVQNAFETMNPAITIITKFVGIYFS